MMNNDNDDINVLALAKIIDKNCHEYLESRLELHWTDPRYIFWNAKREESIRLAKLILDAGYIKNTP